MEPVRVPITPFVLHPFRRVRMDGFRVDGWIARVRGRMLVWYGFCGKSGKVRNIDKMAEICVMRIPKRETQHQSFEGQLLVASAQMEDPRFAKSVVLLLHHDEQSAMGIVLNKPLSEKPKAAFQKLLGGSDEPRDFFAGGPVSGPVIAIALAFHEASDIPQSGNVMIIKEPKQLDELKQLPHDNLLLFIGHAGWGAGQLEEELKRGDWHQIPARADLLFGQDRDDMWDAAIEEIGLEFYRSALGIVDFPEDVTAN